MTTNVPGSSSSRTPRRDPHRPADAAALATRLALVSLLLSGTSITLWLLFWSAAGSSDLLWLATLPAGVLLNGVGLMMALVARQRAALVTPPEVRRLARAAVLVALLPLAGSALYVGLRLALGG